MKMRQLGQRPASIRTALVLSGGGAKGAYQIGVIRGLICRGIKPDLIVGSSIGAFNGALLAECIKMGLPAEDICQRLAGAWSRVGRFLRLNWEELFKKLLNLQPLALSSVYSTKEVSRLFRDYVSPGRSFHEYYESQLSVIGTNLDKKSSQVFDFNSQIAVEQAVMASMAYPVAYPSQKIGPDHYIDGGALNNAPLKEAILWGAREIYLVFLTPLSEIETGEPVDPGLEDREQLSALEVMDRFLELAGTHLMYADFRKARRINHLLRLLNRYEPELPAGFVDELCDLFKLKKGEGKRLVKIHQIAPETTLKPPGTIGFDQDQLLQDLIKKGEQAAAALFQD
ncbi:MAG: patatin-like phospholipase family protein [Bacillota bacterium]